MNIVIFGPPGAGKGTQSNFIVKKFKLHQLSTGELLRKEIKNNTQVLDIGTMDKDVSVDENSDPKKYQSQALMRYNTLMTQRINMMIPLNTNLSAGDLVECNFPRASSSEEKEFDQETSGLYMIKELCHHFDVKNSYTSLKLVRDSYGQKK